MTTHGAQMDRKWTGSGLEVTGSGPEVGQKWTGCVHLSVRTSVHPKHFPYLLDEPYARDLQAQGAFFRNCYKFKNPWKIISTQPLKIEWFLTKNCAAQAKKLRTLIFLTDQSCSKISQMYMSWARTVFLVSLLKCIQNDDDGELLIFALNSYLSLLFWIHFSDYLLIVNYGNMRQSSLGWM